MKNLFISYLAAAVMTFLAIFTCNAQDNVERQFQRFENMVKNDNSIVTSSKKVSYRDDKTGIITGNCAVCEFRLNADISIVKDITKAMQQDEGQAYHSASNTAGNQGVTYAIAYGSGKNDYELIGVDKNMNFKVVCFKDKNHDEYRTSYAIEWKQNDNGNYIGKLFKIYGMKPSKMINYNDKEINVFNIDTLINLGSLKKLDALKDLENLNIKGLGNDKNYNFKIYSNNGYRGFTLNNDDDESSQWLTDFGLYCNKFKEKVQQSPTKGAVYATEILKLCKRANGVLTSGEKKLCIKSLKECQKCTDDTFVNGLLDEAINWLNGKYKKDLSNNTGNYHNNHLKFA